MPQDIKFYEKIEDYDSDDLQDSPTQQDWDYIFHQIKAHTSNPPTSIKISWTGVGLEAELDYDGTTVTVV